MEAQAGLAGIDQNRQAPLAVGLLDHEDAVAALDAKNEAALELVQDQDALGALPGLTGGFGLEFLQNGLACFDIAHELGAA